MLAQEVHPLGKAQLCRGEQPQWKPPPFPSPLVLEPPVASLSSEALVCPGSSGGSTWPQGSCLAIWAPSSKRPPCLLSPLTTAQAEPGNTGSGKEGGTVSNLL